jgi:hypothetical protein
MKAQKPEGNIGMTPKSKSFWETAPGVLTAIATFLTALAGLVGILYQTGAFSSHKASVGDNRAEKHLHYHLIKALPISLSGCVIVPLSEDERTSSGSFFTASAKGDYRLSINTNGPECPTCYDFVMQLYSSANPPVSEEPLRHSLLSESNKSANWDDVVDVSMKQGDSLWLRACPCGNNHCQGPVNTEVTDAVVDIDRL